jgi:hypothetical protein
MENLKITVTITDGNKEVKGTTDVKSCESMKNDFGISKIDEMVSMLTDEITFKSKQETLNKTNNMTAVEQVIFDLFDGNPPQWAKLIIKEGLEKEKEQMIAFAEYTSIIDQEKSDMKKVLDFYLTLGEEIVEDETPNEQIEINQEEPKQETLEEVDEKNLKNKNK